MADFQNKKNKGKLKESKPVLAILIVIIAIFSWNIVHFAGKMNDTIRKRKVAEERLEELAESKSRLDQEINSLQSDKGVEASIREKFGLAKEGEELTVVVSEDANTGSAVEKDSSLWDKIKGWFR